MIFASCMTPEQAFSKTGCHGPFLFHCLVAGSGSTSAVAVYWRFQLKMQQSQQAIRSFCFCFVTFQTARRNQAEAPSQEPRSREERVTVRSLGQEQRARPNICFGT